MQAAVVRYVYPGSPAAEAKIEPGDVIVSAAGEEVEDRDALHCAISGFEPGMSVELEVRHKDKPRKVTVRLAELPTDLPPAALPAARPLSSEPAGDGEKAKPKFKVGRIELSVCRIQERGLGLRAGALRSGRAARRRRLAARQHGVPIPKALLALWKPLCDATTWCSSCRRRPATTGRPTKPSFRRKARRPVEDRLHGRSHAGRRFRPRQRAPRSPCSWPSAAATSSAPRR